MLVIGSIFVLLFGLFMALLPALWWEMTESWKSNATEPSDRYLLTTRINGAFFAIVGLACLIGTFFLD
ncbi:MAG: hypothetical protein IJ350_06490 [Clostridia bacterium]|nr:hypothetical protein [Clostridia bacterium]